MSQENMTYKYVLFYCRHTGVAMKFPELFYCKHTCILTAYWVGSPMKCSTSAAIHLAQWWCCCSWKQFCNSYCGI